MKNFFLFVLFLLSVFLSEAAHYKILFIGNSYTGVNNLPQLIHDVSLFSGDTIIFSSCTPGGATFKQQVTQSLPYIQQGGWDYVVLQAQSQEPSFPYGQFMSQTYPYAKQLCENIREYNPSARIVFYMTWGRENGDSYNCQFYSPLCTYEGMDSLLHARYMMMAEDNFAEVSPVGYVWHSVRENYPEIELYQSDESHPSLAGSYLASCCFYTIFFGKTPNQITYNPGIPEEQALKIRNTVKSLVFDSLYKWSFAEHDSVPVLYHESNFIKIFPNPACSKISIVLCEHSFDKYDVKIFSMQGNLIKHISECAVMKEEINVSDLRPGVYIVSISSSNHVIYRRKFIKIE